jgi:hypothetical protein
MPSLGRGPSPFWHVTLNTVKALEKMGLLAGLPSSTNYPIAHYPALADRVLTESGLAAAHDRI